MFVKVKVENQIFNIPLGAYKQNYEPLGYKLLSETVTKPQEAVKAVGNPPKEDIKNTVIPPLHTKTIATKQKPKANNYQKNSKSNVKQGVKK